MEHFLTQIAVSMPQGGSRLIVGAPEKEMALAHIGPEFRPQVSAGIAKKSEAPGGEDDTRVGAFIRIVGHGKSRSHAATEYARCIEGVRAGIASDNKHTGRSIKTAVHDRSISHSKITRVFTQECGHYSIRKCAHAQVAESGCAKTLPECA